MVWSPASNLRIPVDFEGFHRIPVAGAYVRRQVSQEGQPTTHIHRVWPFAQPGAVDAEALLRREMKKTKFSAEWACLVPKVLVSHMASFQFYLEPPSCHITQKTAIY